MIFLDIHEMPLNLSGFSPRSDNRNKSTPMIALHHCTQDNQINQFLSYRKLARKIFQASSSKTQASRQKEVPSLRWGEQSVQFGIRDAFMESSQGTG